MVSLTFCNIYLHELNNFINASKFLLKFRSGKKFNIKKVYYKGRAIEKVYTCDTIMILSFSYEVQRKDCFIIKIKASVFLKSDHDLNLLNKKNKNNIVKR